MMDNAHDDIPDQEISQSDQLLANVRHELAAQYRAAGDTVVDAYHKAGTGRLHRHGAALPGSFRHARPVTGARVHAGRRFTRNRVAMVLAGSTSDNGSSRYLGRNLTSTAQPRCFRALLASKELCQELASSSMSGRGAAPCATE
jgi:hypothetical protein